MKQLIFKEGVTDSEVLAARLRITREQLNREMSGLRNSFKDLLPPSKLEEKRKVREQIASAKTDAQIREAHQFVNLRLYRDYPELVERPLKIARQAGFRLNNDSAWEFIEVLKERGIHVTEVIHSIKNGANRGKVFRYYFVLKQQSAGVRAAFEDNPRLAKYKRLKSARQVAGPRVELPITTLFKNKDHYVPVGRLFRYLKQQDKSRFLQECPVPLFGFNKGTYLVSESDLGIFNAALEEFKQALQV